MNMGGGDAWKCCEDGLRKSGSNNFLNCRYSNGQLYP